MVTRFFVVQFYIIFPYFSLTALGTETQAAVAVIKWVNVFQQIMICADLTETIQSE